MIVLLPAYQPGDRLPALVAQLRDAAPDTTVLVVDDGSDRAAAPALAAAERLGAAVLRHPANRGKGAALRTGLRHVRDTGAKPVVTADADGQHGVADVLRVADRLDSGGHLTLGVRRFDGVVPLRSRVGNAVTGALFRAATGRGTHDTQTGLRGYPADLLDWLLAVPGKRFAYEMNVLLHAARAGLPVDEVPVSTTYLDGNASSHFGSLADSARVYAPLLRFAAAGLLRGGPA